MDIDQLSYAKVLYVTSMGSGLKLQRGHLDITTVVTLK